MRVVGIISEYNPFHSGHAYQIQKAKQELGADFVVVIMNGDFVQRGEPAIYDKYTRCQDALKGGADLVFELPVRFGISSAGDFAYGGVLALESLGFVTDLSFGSEIGNIQSILSIANILSNESAIFQNALKRGLKNGLSYPAAQMEALEFVANEPIDSSVLEMPNNILGIEYCIALNKLNSKILPMTIVRNGQGYNDAGTVTSGHPSSSSLRKKINATSNKHLVLNDFSAPLGYSLLRSSSLTKYKDISSDLEGRIKSFLPNFQNFEDFVKECSTKSFTVGRIKRGLLQCMLNIEETNTSLPYLRLLGMRKRASVLLQQIPDSLKIISRLAIDTRKLSQSGVRLLAQDVFASDLYRQTWNRKYQVQLKNEFQHSPLIFDDSEPK